MSSFDDLRSPHSTPARLARRGEPTSERKHTPPPPRPRRENESFIVEIFKFAILALVIVIPFRMFIAQPFIVSGASMSPTFETGQYLIIDQLTYQFNEPARGDVVVFKFPEDPSKFFIKRVVGLPGERVEIDGTSVAVIEPATGERLYLDESYLTSANLKEEELSVSLRPDEYFVMGDNRAASSDSRVWGPVPQELIVGRALIRLLPISSIDLLPGSVATSIEQP